MPSFAIEVAGETNPLTDTLLVSSLSSAVSSDPTQVQTGTKQLQQWEKSSGYYTYLQTAYLDHRLPVEIRYLAIIQLKNGIDKYWRRTASNAVSKLDKETIRNRLLDGILNESDNRLAVQNALVIAKIARFEYPHNWPDALTSITTLLRSQLTPLQLARALLAMLHIVKELSTGRLQRTRQTVHAATPEIVHVLSTLYASSVDSWQNTQSSDNAETSMHLSLLALKVMRRLFITGYDFPNRDSEVRAIWSLTLDHLSAFLQIEKQASSATAILIEKHMVQIAKLHHEMAQQHPVAFALLPNSVQLTGAYWSLVKNYGETFGSKEAVASRASATANSDGDADDAKKSSIEKMALKGLLIIRACVKMVHSLSHIIKYRTPEGKEERTRAIALMQDELLKQFFIQEVMEVVVTKFFIFRASDLREWEEDPEEWEKREEGAGEDWEFSVRSCSEKLFLDFAIYYKEIMVQPLLQVFYSVATTQNEDVLFKDSVYTAIGLAAPAIHEHVDFDSFIRDVLAAEVQKEVPGFNIIRRRAAILLGQWISVKVSVQSRPLVFDIFQYLLRENDKLNDHVVRITAGRQFKNICDSWEFQPKDFLPYAETTLTRLMDLINVVELTETKMALLNSISVAVERLGHHILPFADRIVSMLPGLWNASGDEHLMKQAILTVLGRLVNAMKADSLPIHGMVFPIIRGAVEPGSETQVYLLDDAMDLWASILVQTPAPASKEILALVPYLYPIYEVGSENLRKALEITESYVLLAPEYMLSPEGRVPLFTAATALLGSVGKDANGIVCNLIEIALRSASRLGGETAVSQTVADLVQVGFLGKLLQSLQGSWAAHCTTGPLRKDPPIDGIAETDYFSVLARLVLGSIAAFCQFCQHAVQQAEVPSSANLDQTMKWLLEEWFSNFENIGDPSRRKLMCLAITKLLETNQPWILRDLQQLMTLWTDVVSELREDAEDTPTANAIIDSLIYADPGPPAYEGDEMPEAQEDVRRRHLTYSDEVRTVALPQFIKENLAGAVAAGGGEQTFQQEWLANVDRDVLDGFLKLGIM